MKVKFYTVVQDFLKQDFNVSLTIGYLCLVVIGMLFQVFLYSFFGINIVQYSDISDFLLAPFRDPKILIFTFFSAFIIYTLSHFNDWLDNRFPKLYNLMMLGINKKKIRRVVLNQGYVPTYDRLCGHGCKFLCDSKIYQYKRCHTLRNTINIQRQ